MVTVVARCAATGQPAWSVRGGLLLRRASMLDAIDADMAGRLTPAVIGGIVALIPEAWLDAGAAAARAEDYARYLMDRLAAPRAFVEEAVRAC